VSAFRESPEPPGETTSTILIRADATKEIGTGHLARTMALAHAWKRRGGRAVFLVHTDIQPILGRIRESGFGLVSVEQPFPCRDDLELTVAKARQGQDAKWIVVDGYHFTPNYQSALKQTSKKLLVIDDFNHQPLYHADVLLNQNSDAKRLDYHCDPGTVLLLGPRFALLREEFLYPQERRTAEPEVAHRILITMGGADPANATEKVLRGLFALGDPDLEVRVILGPSNPYGDHLRKTLEEAPFTVELLGNVQDMRSCMIWADFVITAGGSTCLELARLGISFLIVVVAENQALLSTELEKSGAAQILGRVTDLTPADVAQAVLSFQKDREKRAAFSHRGPQLVDGLGASRVAESMEPTELKLRSAEERDCEWVWRVSNDPVVREASFSTNTIPLELHRAWFADQIKSPNHAFYVGTNQHDAPVGQIRFAIEHGEAEVSLSLCQEFRTLGLGWRLIQMGSGRVMEEKGVRKVRARIKKENLVSFRSFERAGYRPEGEDRQIGRDFTRMIYERQGQF
jgi:UDP-2,4-diacetamido-2,4,6-trideoxy-beta-L-altropyranose hydrolase